MAIRWGLSKGELTTHFVHQLGVKRTLVKAFFAELERFAGSELKRTGEFAVPGIAKIVVQDRRSRVGRHPRTGVLTRFPAKQPVLKARVARPLKESVLPKGGS